MQCFQIYVKIYGTVKFFFGFLRTAVCGTSALNSVFAALLGDKHGFERIPLSCSMHRDKHLHIGMSRDRYVPWPHTASESCQYARPGQDLAV